MCNDLDVTSCFSPPAGGLFGSLVDGGERRTTFLPQSVSVDSGVGALTSSPPTSPDNKSKTPTTPFLLPRNMLFGKFAKYVRGYSPQSSPGYAGRKYRYSKSRRTLSSACRQEKQRQKELNGSSSSTSTDSASGSTPSSPGTPTQVYTIS